MKDAFEDKITDEEREIQMGGELSEEEVETEEVKPEGTGTPDADEKNQADAEAKVKADEEAKAQAEADKAKEEPDKLTEDEKKDVESQGLKVETDKKGRTYVIDSEGTKIPEARFGKFYRKGKEADTLKRENEELKDKQTLFKTFGADEYYKLYPDEAPEGYKPPEPVRRTVSGGQNVLDFPVTGGQYNGLTLREVMQQDPEDGTRMLNEWKDKQYQSIREQEETFNQKKREDATASYNFGTARSKELFGIDDMKKLTPEQDRKIYLVGKEVLDWQVKNKRLNLSWEDAYTIMKHADLIKRAREEGASSAVKGLQKAGPPSINTGSGGDVKPSGWEEVSQMNHDQFSKHIESLNDVSFKKFLKEAPASIRVKYPDIDWK